MKPQRLLPFTLLIALLTVANAADHTSTWNSTTGNWTDTTKWSTPTAPGTFPNNGSPSPTYDAVQNDGTLTVNQAITVQKFNLNGGTNTGGGFDLTTNDVLTLGGGQVNGSGAINALGGAAFSGGFITLGDSRVVNLSGSSTWSAGQFFFNQSSLLLNTAGSLLTTNFDGVMSRGSGGSFINAGTFTKSGGTGTTTIQVALNNTGTVNVSSGALDVTGGGTSTGAWNAQAGATLNFGNGTQNLNAGTNTTGAGTVGFSFGTTHFNAGTYNVNGTTKINGGTANFNAAASTNLLNISPGGVLGGSGTVTASGLMTWTGGNIVGTGILNANGGAAFSGEFMGLGDSRVVNLSGSSTWSAGHFYFHQSSSLVNTAGSLLTTNSDGLMNRVNGGSFTNAGTFTKSGGTGTTTIQVALNNTGTVNVNSGTLSATGGGTSTGAWNAQAGATLNFGNGTQNLNAGTNITGAGTVGYSFGTTHFNAGTYNVSGTTRINGGTANFNAAASTNLLNISPGGVLGGSGTVTASGLMTCTGGDIVGTGILNANGGVAFSGGFITLGDSRVVNLSGSSTWSAGQFFFNQSSLLLNTAGSLLTTNFDGVMNRVNGGSFTNAGTFTKSGGTGTTTIQVAFSNTGTVNANSGTILFSHSYTQTAGALALNGGNVSGSTFVVQGGKVQGGGTISGTVTASTGGFTIEPGIGSIPAALAITGDLTLTSGSKLSFDIGGTAPGTQHDRITEAGSSAMNLNGCVLELVLTNSFIPSPVDTFVIVSSNQAIAGTFGNLTNGRCSTKNGLGSFAVTVSGSSVTLSNFEANPAPVAANGTSAGNEDAASIVGILSAEDAQNDTLTFSKVSDPLNGTVTVNAGGSFSYVPNTNFHGSDSFTFKASDGVQDSNVATINLTVNPVNDAPTLAAINNPAAILEDAGQQTVNLAGIGTGALNETQVLTVTATSSNPALIPNPTVTYTSPDATGSLSYTPVANVSGTAVITVTVTDDGGTANGGVNTISRTFTVTVTPVNDAPTLAAISDPAAILEDAGQQTVNLVGIGVGALDQTQALMVTATSSNTALIPNPTVTYASPDAAGSLSYTPVANLSGTAEITVTVTDDGGTANGGVDTISRTFTVTVLAVNDSPTLAAITDPAAMLEDTAEHTINLAGIGTGALNETQALTVTATSSNTALIPNPTVTYTSPDAIGSLSYAPVANAHGTAVITVTVTDDGGTANGGVNTISRAFTVTVTPVNDAPTLAAITDPAAILENSGQQTVNFSGIGTGAPDETQALTVTATSSNLALIPNPTVTYASPEATGSLSYTPVANANGTAVITVTVTDDGGTANGGVNTISRTFTVTVTPVNDAPTLAAISDPAAILEDAGQQTVNLVGIGVGALDQTQALMVTATSSNTALIPNPTVTYASPDAAGSLSYTPVANLSGTAEITVTVTDDGGTANGGVDTSSRTFTVTVLAVNDSPTLAAITDPAVMLEDAAEHTINLAGISTGALNETQVLTVTATSSNTELIPNPTVTYTSPDAAGSLSYAPLADVSGTAVITVTVTDDGGTANGGVNNVSRTFTVTVTPVNDAPTLAVITDPAAILENSGQQTVNFSGIGTGAPDETQALTVTATSSNTALIPNPTVTYASPEETGSLSYTPVANANGTAVITVTVTDDGGTANGGVNIFSRTFTVVVTPLNRAPTLAVITDPAAIFEDAAQQTVNLAGIGTGALDETQALMVTATSSNTALIPNPTVTYTSPEATGSLSYTPVANEIGTAIITVTVTDDGGTTNGGVDTFVRTFTVQVLPVNDAPTFSKGANITHFAAATSAQTVSGWATNMSPGPVDEAAQTLAFSITGNTNPDIFTTAPAISSTGTLTYRLSGTAGTSTVSVTLSDDGGTENGGADTSAVQTFTFTVTEVESDYLVTTENGVLTLTDITGNDTTVTMSEPSVGNVLFAASGRSFTVNGLTLTNDNSAPISLAGVSQIVMQLQGGNDALNIPAFANPAFPGLTIHGGEGDDTISFLGDLTFAPNASLEVDLQDDVANPGADTIQFGSLLSASKCELRLSGTGGAILRASARIRFDSPSSGTIPTLLQTENGDVVIEANLQATPTLAGAVAAPAVLIQFASTIRSTATGDVSIRARGPTTTSTSGEYSGITVVNGGQILTHEGDISVEGTCGRNAGASLVFSAGLSIYDSRTSPALPTAIRSSSGDIILAGLGDSSSTTGFTGSAGAFFGGIATARPEITTGGAGGISLTGDCRGSGSSNATVGLNLSHIRMETVDGDIALNGYAKDQGTTNGCPGVIVGGLNQLRSTGTGAVRITGKGGVGSATTGANHGIVWVGAVGSFIKTASGDIALTGTAGTGDSSFGLFRSSGTSFSSLWESVSGSIRLTADRINLEGTGALTITTGPAGQVVLKPETPGRVINIGTGFDLSPTLYLSAAELNRITTTGQLIIGSADSGEIALFSSISRTVAAPVRLVSGGAIQCRFPLATAGGPLTLSPGGVNPNARFSFNGTDLDLGASSSLTFTPGAKLHFFIGGLTAGTQYEQLVLKGGVNLTGGVLALQQLGGFVPGAGTWTLIVNDGTDPVVGTFEGLPEGALVPHAGILLRISYVGGTGNDVVLTRVPGVVGFDPVQYVFNEEDGTVNLRLTRTGGSDGAVSVTVNTLAATGAGKAAAGMDYTSIVGQVVTFAHGETEKNVPLTLLTDTLKEIAETLTVRLSLPGLGGVVRGGATDATVKIIDSGDTSPPTVTLTSPTVSLRITSLSQLSIKGSATDKVGLRKVEFSINGSPFADAVTSFSSLATSATFTVHTPSVLPPGPNTISVRSVDMRGNASPTLLRYFTLVVMSPLTVTRVGAGNLDAGFPGTKMVELASYFVLNATPASGQVFADWRNVNNTPGIGLTANQLEGARITIRHQPGLALEANFIPNPFVAGIIGTFNGVVLPSSTEPALGGTTPSYDQCGSITVTVTSTGSFTGSLRLGSVVKPLTGVFNTSGAARFGGTNRTTSTGFTVEDSSLTASFTMDMTGTTGKLTGTVLRLKRGNQTAAVSVIDAGRAHFSSTNKLPASLAGTTTTGKPYTMALLLRPDQHPDLTLSDYPQGDGFMTATLLPTGVINYTHISPDDVLYLTGSTTVSKLLEWPLHVLSSAGKGSLTGRVKIDESQPDTDMTASGILWFRSFLNRQWYPYGWDEGLVVDLIGTKFAAVEGSSTLAGLGDVDDDGNAQITFTSGGLVAPVITNFNLSTSDVASLTVTTQLWGYYVSRVNGTFSGHFSDPSIAFSSFRGVVLQKGIHQKGFGFFRSLFPPSDYSGQIGRLRLEAQP